MCGILTANVLRPTHAGSMHDRRKSRFFDSSPGDNSMRRSFVATFDMLTTCDRDPLPRAGRSRATAFAQLALCEPAGRLYRNPGGFNY